MYLTRRILKTIFVILLLTINVWQIILPSIRKYLEHGILLEVSTDEFDGLVPPAITICRETSGRRSLKHKSKYYSCFLDRNKTAEG